MSSPAVVGPFDPGDDRDPQLLAGVPAALVEDVLLQEGEEGFHRGIVTAGTDPSRGPDELVAAQAVDESSTSKLRASVAVHDAPGHIDAVCAAARNG